jgi:hypothetical protein
MGILLELYADNIASFTDQDASDRKAMVTHWRRSIMLTLMERGYRFKGAIPRVPVQRIESAGDYIEIRSERFRPFWTRIATEELLEMASMLNLAILEGRRKRVGDYRAVALAMRAEGKTYAEIAAVVGVTRQAVQLMIWRHTSKAK